MTRDEIMTMEPGRELDTLVVELVMGWTRKEFPGQDPNSLWNDEFIFKAMQAEGFTHDDGTGEWIRVPPYSTDIAAAWTVVEKLATIEGPVSVCWGIYATNDDKATVTTMFGPGPSIRAETAPLAICKAALLAVM